jgi:hypothetical protein
MYGTVPEVQALVKPLVDVLDGRGDTSVEGKQSHAHAAAVATKAVSATGHVGQHGRLGRLLSFTGRRKSDDMNTEVHFSKILMLGLMQEISDLRLELRVQTFVAEFRTTVGAETVGTDAHRRHLVAALKDKKLFICPVKSQDGRRGLLDAVVSRRSVGHESNQRRGIEIKIRGVNGDDGRPMRVELTHKLRPIFNKVLHGDKSRQLDLDHISDMPLITVVLDLLMYENDKLFARALGVLFSHFAQQRQLISALSQVQVLSKHEFKYMEGHEHASIELEEVRGKVDIARAMIESIETWGVNDLELRSPTEAANTRQVSKILRMLKEILTTTSGGVTSPNPETQTLLGRGLKVHTITARAFRTIGSITDVESMPDPESRAVLHHILVLCLELQTCLADSHAENQRTMFQLQLPFLLGILSKLADGLDSSSSSSSSRSSSSSSTPQEGKRNVAGRLEALVAEQARVIDAAVKSVLLDPESPFVCFPMLGQRNDEDNVLPHPEHGGWVDVGDILRKQCRGVEADVDLADLETALKIDHDVAALKGDEDDALSEAIALLNEDIASLNEDMFTQDGTGKTGGLDATDLEAHGMSVARARA